MALVVAHGLAAQTKEQAVRTLTRQGARSPREADTARGTHPLIYLGFFSRPTHSLADPRQAGAYLGRTAADRLAARAMCTQASALFFSPRAASERTCWTAPAMASS